MATNGSRAGGNSGKSGTSRIVTPSQTVGPYLHIGLVPVPILASDDIPGDRITISGRVLDVNGDPINDGMLETWQANARGKYNHPEDDQDLQITPGFTGFGRQYTGADGSFRLETIRPGPVPWVEGGKQAPHIVVSVFGRGILKHLITRIYFQDDPMLREDPVLQLVPGERRGTLLAQPDGPAGHYRWDIHLRGEQETVFFDV